MSFNTVGQYTGNMKPWDHVGNIIPDIEHSEGMRPAHEFQVAKWLPVSFFDKYYENWVVVMPGKILGLDQDGFVVPAAYVTGAATTVVYTAFDVTAGTIDIATGVAVTQAKTVTLTQLTGARGGGWTAANAGVGVTSAFMGKWGVAWLPSAVPIGVAPMPFLKHAGGDGFNPANYTFHNYNMQHQVTVLCDYVIKLPLIPGQVTSEVMSHAWNGTAITFGTADGWRNLTWIQGTARYSATTGLYPCLNAYNVAALPLANLPVAKNTARTTLACSDATILVNERTSMGAITAAGDYWVDYDVGVLFVYSWGGTSMPIAGGTTLTYYHYGTVPANLSQFGCILAGTTVILPGDLLQTTTGSNWAYLLPASATPANCMGQVLAIVSEPKGYLEYVRTAYTALNTDSSGTMANQTLGSATANLGQMDQMPGSANQGYSTLVSYAGAANQFAIVNLISR